MGVFRNVLAIYAILMLGGGVMGFVKAKSKMSLIMGIVSALLLFLGVSLMPQGNTEHLAKMLVTVVCLALTVVFAMRYMKTRAFMPSGMLFVVSFIMVIYSITQLSQQVWNP